MTNFSDMLSKAKAMQEKMKEVQDQIKKIEVKGVSGGNLVSVILNGEYEIKSIEISEAAKKENQNFSILYVKMYPWLTCPEINFRRHCMLKHDEKHVLIDKIRTVS